MGDVIEYIDNRTILIDISSKRVVSFKIDEEYIYDVDKFVKLKGCNRSHLLKAVVKALSSIFRKQRYRTEKIIITGVSEDGEESVMINT